MIYILIIIISINIRNSFHKVFYISMLLSDDFNRIYNHNQYNIQHL